MTVGTRVEGQEERVWVETFDAGQMMGSLDALPRIHADLNRDQVGVQRKEKLNMLHIFNNQCHFSLIMKNVF